MIHMNVNSGLATHLSCVREARIQSNVKCHSCSICVFKINDFKAILTICKIEMQLRLTSCATYGVINCAAYAQFNNR